MYVFKRDGQEVAAQEWPVWVQLQENGCYGLCNAADAQGVVLGGKVYSLSNRTPMEGTEEVAAEVVESVPYLREKVDTLESRLAVQTAATEVAFVTLAEAGIIDQATAGKHRTMFADWTAGVAYTVVASFATTARSCTAACRLHVPGWLGAGQGGVPVGGGSGSGGGVAGVEPAHGRARCLRRRGQGEPQWQALDKRRGRKRVGAGRVRLDGERRWVSWRSLRRCAAWWNAPWPRYEMNRRRKRCCGSWMPPQGRRT